MNFRLVLGVFLLVGGVTQMTAAPAIPAVSTPAASTDPLHRDSPRSAVFAFLQACQARNYESAARYIDLRNAPQDQRIKSGPQLAQQLEQILDRDVRFDVASLSGSAEGGPADSTPPKRERVDTFQLNGKPVEGSVATLNLGMS